MPLKSKQYMHAEQNRTKPAQMAEILLAIEDLVFCTDPPTCTCTSEEMNVAIKAMKSGKAGGADSVTPEMSKAEETETPCILTDTYRKESEQNPDMCKTGLIVKISCLRKVTLENATAGEALRCPLLPARPLARSSMQDLQLP